MKRCGDPLRDPRGGHAMCPYIDLNDERCGEKLTLARIDEALEESGGEYGQCPIYRALMAERAREFAAA